MDALKDRIPDYAKDLRLNLSSVLTPQGAPGLTEPQLWMTALAFVTVLAVGVPYWNLVGEPLVPAR